jgi:hypothetical protein
MFVYACLAFVAFLFFRFWVVGGCLFESVWFLVLCLCFCVVFVLGMFICLCACLLLRCPL